MKIAWAFLLAISLNAQTALQLSGLSTPEICFNYLGRFPAPGSADWAAAAETVKLGSGDPAMPLEEAGLRWQFGDRYLEYCRMVRWRLIPYFH